MRKQFGGAEWSGAEYNHLIFSLCSTLSYYFDQDNYLLGFVLRSVGGEEGGLQIPRLLTTVRHKTFNILMKDTA